MTQSEANKPNVLAITAVALIAVVLVVLVVANASHSALDGKWLRVNPKDGSYPGDFIVVKGNSWTMTGNPALAGTLKNEGGKVYFRIEKVGDKTRADAIKEGPSVEMRLKALDEQLIFKSEDKDGKTMLMQVGLSSGFAAEWRFEKMPDRD